MQILKKLIKSFYFANFSLYCLMAVKIDYPLLRLFSFFNFSILGICFIYFKYNYGNVFSGFQVTCEFYLKKSTIDRIYRPMQL